MTDDRLGPALANNVDIEAVFDSLDQGMSVALIATGADQLQTVESHQAQGAIRDARELAEFDVLPVTRNGRICGLLDQTRLDPASSEDTVGRAMSPLGEHNLISAASGILTYMRLARENPYRLIIADNRITGIITQADLHKLPVRVSLFSLITHVELLMAQVIEQHFPDADHLFAQLNSNRASNAQKQWASLRRNNLHSRPVLALQFCDKAEILARHLETALSRRQTKDQFARIETLRNHVAHANDYAATGEMTQKTIDAVGHAEAWIKRLRQEIDKTED